MQTRRMTVRLAALWLTALFGQNAICLSAEPLPLILLHFDDQSGRPVDSSGAEHAIANHGAAGNVPGKFGSAYQFDGKTSYVDAGDNFGLAFAFPTQTMEFWICPDDTDRESGILGSQEKATRSSWRWNFARDAEGRVCFHLYDGGQQPPSRSLTSRAAAPAGQWTHVAVTLDAVDKQQMRLLINGKEEDEGTLKSVSPYGSLFLGGANAGFFAGRIDEVAIYDTVLDEATIARHASGTAPIPDGAGRPDAGPGFLLHPIHGTATVGIRHSAFPGRAWRLRIPEHAYRDVEKESSVQPSLVVWERRKDGSLEFHWNAAEEVKRRQRLDFWGRLTPGDDHIDYELTGKNVGDRPWGEAPWGGVLGLICLGSGGNPAFHDYEANRTFIRRNARWITMNEVLDGKFASHRMAGVPAATDRTSGAARLAAKTSADGKWVLGIATDTATSLSFNFQLRTSCIHSNPGWPPLKPGEQATAEGKIYLLEGGLVELWQRYQADFQAQ